VTKGVRRCKVGVIPGKIRVRRVSRGWSLSSGSASPVLFNANRADIHEVSKLSLPISHTDGRAYRLLPPLRSRGETRMSSPRWTDTGRWAGGRFPIRQMRRARIPVKWEERMGCRSLGRVY
jgi:hypothetical protein